MSDKSQARLESTARSVVSQAVFEEDVLPANNDNYFKATRPAGGSEAILDGDNPFQISTDNQDPVPPAGGSKPKEAPPGKEKNAPKDKERFLGGNGEPARSDAEAYRQRLRDAGIDPDKISTRIGLYEPTEAHDTKQTHAKIVQEVISGQQFGLSQGADARIYSPKEKTPEIRLSQFADSANPIDAFVTAYSVSAMNDLTGFVRDNLLNQDDMRVLNVSQAYSPVFCLKSVSQQLEKDPVGNAAIIRDLLGQEKGDQWIAEQKKFNEDLDRMSKGELSVVLGTPHGKELTSQLNQALMNRISDSLKNNEQFNKAMEDYRAVTKQAAEQGKFVVVAAANDGLAKITLGIDVPDGAAFNWYAMSDHVITVGGSDGNNTPFDRSDDTTYGHTSPGTERWHPDVVSQGASVPTKFALAGSADGTSFAAPRVAAAIGLMLEQNPDLTFSQVRQILRENATPIAGVPSTVQGSGILEIDKAVLAARKK